MQKRYKYHAYIQGRNAYIDWETKIEAIIWRTFYNIWHTILKDGKYITSIYERCV